MPLAEEITKRLILKFTASIFDPLGLLSPTVLLAKLFIQKLWLEKFDWDDSLPAGHISAWQTIVEQIVPISDFNFQRLTGASEPVLSRELHCFCDASQSAYGTCIFLRSTTPTGVFTSLLFAKSRLAPLKELTLPCLELLAVQVGSRCLDFVATSLPFSVEKRFVWTDSQCVLCWLESTKPLTVFVRNRVASIKKFQGVSFRYVPTAENPADLASRGKSAVELFSNALWWNGPPWLCERSQLWPSMDFLSKKGESSSDDNKSILFSTSALAPEGADAKKEEAPEPPLGIDCNMFSSLTKLFRVTARAFKFIDRLKRKKVDFAYWTAIEINDAKILWIKFIQQKCFSDVFSAIKEKRRHRLKEQFDLWVDAKGILRCGGRLSNSDLSDLCMHPMLLPAKDHFTMLVVRNFHQKLFHSGVSHTLAQVRNEFWIPSGRSVVYKVIHACTNCKKFDGGPYKLPPMPPLPKSRVTAAVPFSSTGLDYLGPLHVKNRKSAAQKVWICLFTCLSTRAIHLELIDDMTSEQFLLCLQRFIARRGKPSNIISDNGSQFKLVDSVIAKLWKKVIASKEIANYVSAENIKWKYIIERAPWRGGFYERLVRLVKQCLRKSIGKIYLSTIQLQTVIVEIEAVVNSRPLAYVGSDFSTGQLITPAHFLSLNVKTGTPPVDTDEVNDTDYLGKVSSKDQLIETWKKGQRHLETF